MARFTIKKKECHFGEAYVSYLGHVLGRGEVIIVESKVEAIKKIPILISKKYNKTTVCYPK